MATPNIVPRSDSEGGLGTASKYWASAYIDTITTTGNVNVGGGITVFGEFITLQNVGSEKPAITLISTSNDAEGGHLLFRKDRGQAPVDGDTLGSVVFQGEDSGENATIYAEIRSDIHETTHGDESGELFLSVANNGTLQTGLFMKGDKTTAAQVDVTIGNGAAGRVSVPGKLGVGANSTDVEAALTVKGDPGNTNQPAKITNSAQDTHTGLFLNSTGNAVNEKYGMQFGGFNEYSVGGIFGLIDSTSGSTSGDITIDMCDGTTTNALIERVRFTHEGNVLMTSNDATLTLHAPASPFTPKIDFIRNGAVFAGSGDTHTDYRLIDTGGTFKIQSGHDGTTKDMLTLTGGSGNSAILVGIPFYSVTAHNSMYTHDVSATDDTAQYNTAYGFAALDAITTGDQNVAIGYNAGTSINSASGSVAIGHEALKNEDTQGYNVAVGFAALKNQNADAITYNIGIGYAAAEGGLSGRYNVTIGGEAMYLNQDGDANTAVGYKAMKRFEADTDGHGENTAFGAYAMKGDDTTPGTSTGTQNTAIGANAMKEGVLTGDHNTAVGQNAAKTLTSGVQNVIIGSDTGDALTGGNHNIAVGFRALSDEDTGNNSTAIGYYALNKQNNASNNYNIAVGHSSQQENVTGVYNTTIGGLTAAAMNNAHYNVLIGMQAGTSLTTAGYNTAIGTFSLYKEDTRGYNTAVGYDTLRYQNAGADAYSTAVGFQSSRNNRTGVKNTTVGGYAGLGILAGDFNVAVGHKALHTAGAGNRSTAIGYQALESQYTTFTETGGATTNGDQSVTHTADARIVTGLAVSGTGIPSDSFVGVISSGTTFNLVNENGDAVNATADGSSLTLTFTGGQDANNTAVGYHAGIDVTTGTLNTIVGSLAGVAVTTSYSNTFLGYDAGGSTTTGSTNTFIGANAGNSNVGGGNNIAIGRDADVGGANFSNSITIGTSVTNNLGTNSVEIGNTSMTKFKTHGAMENRAYTGTAEGSGIDATDAVSISVGEYNSEIITNIFVDIGNQTGGTIQSSSTDNGAIGNATDANAYITRVTTAVNGIVYKAELICVETPTISSGSLQADLDLRANASGTIASGSAVSGSPICNSAGDHALGRFVRSADSTTNTITPDHYLYLAQSGTNAGVYNAGKFLIRLYGAKVTGL